MKKYIEKVKQLVRIFPPRQEGQSGEEHAKQRVILGIKYGAFVLAAFAVLRGVLVVAGESVTVSNSVDGRELPIYCVETQEKKIALSFDAAWGNEDTAKILEILKKHDVHVTFFMTGGWVESYPDDVKAILAAGHDLGNHSENHKNMSQLSDEEKKEELMQVHTRVQELTGYDMFLFRPPYGDYDNAVVNVAKDCGYYTIQWDVDSLDWKDYGVDSIIKTVTQHKHLGNGSIILCHNGAHELVYYQSKKFMDLIEPVSVLHSIFSIILLQKVRLFSLSRA